MTAFPHFPKLTLAAIATFCLSFAGCGESDRSGENDIGDKIRTMVSVPPQADFVKRIGGEYVHVEVLVGDGQDPHTFSPTPAQMKALGRSKVFFTVGMPFEELLAKKIVETQSGITVVDTSAGIEKIALECDHPSHDLEGEGGEPAEHDDEHDHDHEHHEDDPHIWLAPNLIKLQAAHIARALTELDAEHADAFAANLAKFETELDELHAELSAKTKPYIGKDFFVFHPAFGYFGHTYGVEQVAVEVAGNNPTARELSEFLERASKQGIKVLFVQPQFDSRSAEVVARQLDAEVVALDPLAPDVLANLRAIADAIVAGLAQ